MNQRSGVRLSASLHLAGPPTPTPALHASAVKAAVGGMLVKLKSEHTTALLKTPLVPTCPRAKAEPSRGSALPCTASQSARLCAHLSPSPTSTTHWPPPLPDGPGRLPPQASTREVPFSQNSFSPEICLARFLIFFKFLLKWTLAGPFQAILLRTATFQELFSARTPHTDTLRFIPLPAVSLPPLL